MSALTESRNDSFRTGYLDAALYNLEDVLDAAERDLRGFHFDTLVGTGFSGALVVPALALRLGKEFVLVRKEGDGSHHSGKLIGRLGERWIFLDDFTCSGKTRDRVMAAIQISAHERDLETEHVGDYWYAGRSGYGSEPRFEPIHLAREGV
jgi:hypothetical protein